MAETDEASVPCPSDISVVDETLLKWMATLSPVERLRHNDRTIQMILQLRQGMANRSKLDHD